MATATATETVTRQKQQQRYQLWSGARWYSGPTKNLRSIIYVYISYVDLLAGTRLPSLIYSLFLISSEKTLKTLVFTVTPSFNDKWPISWNATGIPDYVYTYEDRFKEFAKNCE